MRIEEKQWGSVRGQAAHIYEIDGEKGLSVSISDYGGVIQSLKYRKVDGSVVDIVLGYDTLEEYVDSCTFFGACIGPIADRMAEGRCILNGEDVRLPLNAGPDSMHSGTNGFHSQVWNAEILSVGVALSRRFTRDETGYPGELCAKIGFRIADGNALRIEYEGVCDIETALSLTNHSYFSLNGGGKDCRDQRLKLFADEYAETMRDIEPIVTGRALPVSGTPFDLREGGRLGDVLDQSDFREIRTGGGIDHYFITPGTGFRPHAVLEDKESGLRLTCLSDAPGLLVYSANGLDAEKGRGGAVYGRNYAVCFETERFPNAVNLPQRRSKVILKPGERFRSVTEFRIEEI